MSMEQKQWQWRKRLRVQLLCRAVCICNVASHWEMHYLELWIISGKQCVVRRYFRREGRQGSPVHGHRRMRAGGHLGAQPPGFASSTAHIRTRDINSIPTAETELILFIFWQLGETEWGFLAVWQQRLGIVIMKHEKNHEPGLGIVRLAWKAEDLLLLLFLHLFRNNAHSLSSATVHWNVGVWLLRKSIFFSQKE